LERTSCDPAAALTLVELFVASASSPSSSASSAGPQSRQRRQRHQMQQQDAVDRLAINMYINNNRACSA
jgi:hypothetical protein